MITLIKAGAVYHLLFAVFHLFWPKLFHWNENLSGLDDINKTLLPIMSGLFIYIYTMVFIVSFFFSDILYNSVYGKLFLGSVSLFWIVRGGMQFKYFNMKEKEARLFLIIIIAGIGMYGLPVFV